MSVIYICYEIIYNGENSFAYDETLGNIDISRYELYCPQKHGDT